LKPISLALVLCLATAKLWQSIRLLFSRNSLFGCKSGQSSIRYARKHDNEPDDENVPLGLDGEEDKRHGEPRVITLDGFELTHAALRRMGMNNEFNYRWDDPVQIRNCPYLNNVVEQDHRRIKSRVSPMLGFKSFFNARWVLAGRRAGSQDHQRPVWSARELRHGPLPCMV
jgi:hypothetical protein